MQGNPHLLFAGVGLFFEKNKDQLRKIEYFK